LPRNLTAQEHKEVRALETRLEGDAAEGKFAEAARLAEQVAGLRAQRQGARHWQAINARFKIADWQRFAKVPAADRAAIVQARGLNALGSRLLSWGRSREAEKRLQEAQAIFLEVLGEHHPETARSYNEVARFLEKQGKHGDALSLHRRALAIRLKVFGEQHPYTATSYNNVAFCLDKQGKHHEALPLHRRALAIRCLVLGEMHPDTAISYSNVAFSLDSQGKRVEALPLFQRALAIFSKALGEHHPYTATSFNNVAHCLLGLGRYAEALPLFQRALAVRRLVHLGGHPEIAASQRNLAACLVRQGKHAEALPLCRGALAIRLGALGEHHPHTAQSYHDVALCLDNQGKHGEALPLHRRALAIRLKALGEHHPDTANSCHVAAQCLDKQRKHGEALALYRRALAIYLEVCGEQHPHTADVYKDLARCLGNQGKHAEALPLHRRALAIRVAVLGEQHPDTAISYNEVALSLNRQGRRAEALRFLQACLPNQEAARFNTASTGFERGLASASKASPHAMLAAGLARLAQPGNALRHAEFALARGLLDDLARSEPDQRDRIAGLSGELERLDRQLVPLLIAANLTREQTELRDQLTRQRRAAQVELARLAASVSARQVLPLERIQRQIPPDAALVLWLDELGEHLGCVLRRQGPPAWVSLRGSGKAGRWTEEDTNRPDHCYAALSDPSAGAALRTALYRQRVAPLTGHLKGVKHLLVIPTGALAKVPVEALSDRWTVSYVPSGSAFARALERPRKSRPTSALVLADPVFTATATPPHHRKVDDEGEALEAWRAEERKLFASPMGKQWRPLPGTRLEARALARLLPSAKVLLGTAASEQALEEMAASGKLNGIGLLHLATHGEANPSQPLDTALILAQDRLPHPREQEARVLAGKRPLKGLLTVDTILRHWRLDADLVTLSACQTGLGADVRGEGMLGFAQALLQRGARAVVLSRWKVDDTATALLMVRFYENLLGKRKGARPMPRALALHEAKRWLRGLSRAELAPLAAGLAGGALRGTEKDRLPLRQGKVPSLPRGERPFAHPYYWAAFVLIGDPR
jgi:CHAT domain-containing protein/Tfp pilus assembly protein PilF